MWFEAKRFFGFQQRGADRAARAAGGFYRVVAGTDPNTLTLAQPLQYPSVNNSIPSQAFFFFLLLLFRIFIYTIFNKQLPKLKIFHKNIRRLQKIKKKKQKYLPCIWKYCAWVQQIISVIRANKILCLKYTALKIYCNTNELTIVK